MIRYRQRDKNLWEAIREKWTQSQACPTVGTERVGVWGSLRPPGCLPGSEVGTTHGATEVYALIPVGCRNCGYMHFFNRNTLFPKAEEEE